MESYAQYLRYQEKVLERKEQLRKTLETNIAADYKNYTLEIGCGHGDFLTAYAEKFPNDFCIGIDLLNQRLKKCVRKSDRKGLKNTLFLKAEANEFLETLQKDITFENVFILYPDPWPKRRHAVNRLIQHEFIQKLESCLIPNGKVFFKTDDENYYLWSKNVFSKTPYWCLEEGTIWPCVASTYFSRVMSSPPREMVWVFKGK